MTKPFDRKQLEAAAHEWIERNPKDSVEERGFGEKLWRKAGAPGVRDNYIKAVKRRVMQIGAKSAPPVSDHEIVDLVLEYQQAGGSISEAHKEFGLEDHMAYPVLTRRVREEKKRRGIPVEKRWNKESKNKGGYHPPAGVETEGHRVRQIIEDRLKDLKNLGAQNIDVEYDEHTGSVRLTFDVVKNVILTHKEDGNGNGSAI